MSLRKMIEDELERRRKAVDGLPLSFIVAPDGAPGAMTDVGEAVKAAVMVRDDEKRIRVPIARSIADAVGAAAQAANPRPWIVVMHWIFAPGAEDLPARPWQGDTSQMPLLRQTPEATSPTADEPDLVARIAGRIAKLRDDSGAGKAD